jgi:hypothetical protein
MHEALTVEVTTRVFGLGNGRVTAPTLVTLEERTLSARQLIAEHVRAELAQIDRRRMSSLALHYMLADDVRTQPGPVSMPELPKAEAEIRRAWQGLAERRYLLVVDGIAVDDLDATLTLTERSAVSFLRLLPLIGG